MSDTRVEQFDKQKWSDEKVGGLFIKQKWWGLGGRAALGALGPQGPRGPGVPRAPPDPTNVIKLKKSAR